MTYFYRACSTLFFTICLVLCGDQVDASNVKNIDPLSFTFKLRPAVQEATDHYDVVLRFNMENGWRVAHPKTTNPEGVPPQISWGESKNVKAVNIYWPKKVAKLRDGSEVLLRVKSQDATKPVSLVLRIAFSVCNVECRYFDEKIAADLPTLINYQEGDTKIAQRQKILKAFPEYPIVVIFIAAFLGGLILNFMPCVLPVLSLKLMAFTRQDLSILEIRRKTFMTFIGILFSFWLLATCVVILRSFGVLVGWGMHFQQPVFIGFMMLVLTVFGLNMLGFFEVHIPRLMNLNVQCSRDSIWSDFWLGALATLMATPCSAPFLGTAVGYALTHDIVAIYTVFTVLGLGFGFPYLLIIFYPGVHSLLPKPGPWMQKLRNLLGLGLIVTAVWLGAILFQELSSQVIDPSRVVINKKRREYRFSPQLLQKLINEDKLVFVDITARWCVTCIANKQLVLTKKALRDVFKKEQVFVLVGDWTTPSSEITRFINSHGRYGIPFNGFFSKKCAGGKLLPEVLTHDRVVQALKSCR